MPDAADTHSHRSKPGSLCDPGSDAGVGRSPDPPARTHRKRGSAAFLRAVPRRRSVLHRGSGGARVLPCAHAQQKLAKKEARKRPDLRGLEKRLGRRAWRKARRLLLFSLSHICAKLTTPSRKFFRPPFIKREAQGKCHTRGLPGQKRRSRAGAQSLRKTRSGSTGLRACTAHRRRCGDVNPTS